MLKKWNKYNHPIVDRYYDHSENSTAGSSEEKRFYFSELFLFLVLYEKSYSEPTLIPFLKK